MTFSTQRSRLKAILSVMPKTASVFSLLTVRAPAGLHLVEALQQETAGRHSAPRVPICPCFRFFLSEYVCGVNAFMYLYQTASPYYLIFPVSKITTPSLMALCDHRWTVLLFSFGCFWSWASSVFLMQDSDLWRIKKKKAFCTGNYMFFMHWRTGW